MKKIIIVTLIGIGIGILGASKDAGAQVLLSNRCCDTFNVVRCLQVNFTPVGGPCFCVGQGNGHTC